MLKNYIKIAFRNLWKSPGYSLINIVGLAVGIGCCLLIGMYVRYELSYDRFHEKADQIYRITLERRSADETTHTATTPPGLAHMIDENLTGIEQSFRLWYEPYGPMTIRYRDQAFPEEHVVFADSNVFRGFSYELTRGSEEAALRAPFSIVLTEKTARKYFGEEDPIGKSLKLKEPADRTLFEYVVTGIVADPPAQSHVHFDFLASISSHHETGSNNLGYGTYTYVLLQEGTDPSAFEEHLNEVTATQADFQIENGEYRFHLQPLTRIHLHSRLENEIGANRDARSLVLFAAIGLFVLLLACVNFINLSTARGAMRAQEVGVRKTVGAVRGQLIGQFLVESLALCFLAVGLAVLLADATIPVLSDITGTELAAAMPSPVLIFSLLIGLCVLVAVAAGFYPAFILSSFHPKGMLKAGNTTAGGLTWLRDGLIVFQFAVSIVLMVGTLIVYGQMRFMQEQHLGFDAERVVVFEGTEVMGTRMEAFKQEALELRGVERITNSELVPGRSFATAQFHLDESSDGALVAMDYTYIGFDFVETYGLELTEGRSLSRAFASDSLAVVLNETAIEQLGLHDPLGKRLVWPNESVYTIIGVVRDFHVASLRREIAPVALLGPDPRNTNRPNMLVSARVTTRNLPATIAALGEIWKSFAPGQPFVYRFLDADFDALYHWERLWGRLFGGFAVLALLLGCIGLLGLAAFAAEQRTKEIGIRKVMGASVAGIVALLNKDFLKLVLIGFVLAIPIAWYTMNQWLEDFAYRIEIGPGVFLLAGLAAVLIALATVSWQSVKAAVANPVEALRSE